MSALWTAFRSAPATQAVFALPQRVLTWADVRASVDAASDAVRGTDGPLFLYTQSAAAFLAGLLAAMTLRRPVICPAYAGYAYLDEIAVGDGLFVTETDGSDGLSLQARVVGAGSGTKVPAPASTSHEFSLTFMTSGTTAQPKAVTKVLSALEREVDVLEALWGGADGPVIATVSHQHIYGFLFRVLWPAIAGRLSDALRTEFWEKLDGRLGSRCMLVSGPAHLSRLPGETVFRAGGPRMIFSSGGPLARADAKRCEARLGQLPVEVFGSTETGGIAWRQQQADNAPWTPFPGVDIGVDAAGLLSVQSSWTGADGPVIVGDRVRLDACGQFHFLGRADAVVKIEGKRVSLTRVEQALCELPEVRDAGTTVIEGRSQVLAAVVVLTPQGNRELQRLGSFAFSRHVRRQLTARLAPLERPKAWRFVEHLPTNSEGKRTRAAMRSLFTLATTRTEEQAVVRLKEPYNAEVDFVLDGDSIWFEGHFPGQPIFPGIAEVHLAVVWGARLWDGWHPASSHLTRLKFSRILRPGDRVRLMLVRNLEKDTLRFRYLATDKVAGEGLIGGKL